MPTWVPIAVLVVVWSAVAVSLLWQWYRYVQASRRGVMRREDLTSNVTADLISLGVAVGIAYLINDWVADWLIGQQLAVSEWILFLGYMVTALVTASIVSRLYHRFVDSRVRAFLASDPATESHASESEHP